MSIATQGGSDAFLAKVKAKTGISVSPDEEQQLLSTVKGSVTDLLVSGDGGGALQNLTGAEGAIEDIFERWAGGALKKK